MMKNLLNDLEEVILMGPGPSCVPDEVYTAMSKYTLGHMDSEFIKIMDGIKSMLQQLMHTENKLTIPVSGTGSAGMETCFVNLIERGDPVLILKNGVFGNRMEDVAGRLGAEVEILESEWGTPILPDEVKLVLQKRANAGKGPFKFVAVVHAETSTGVENPVEDIGKLVNETGALYLVDAVTSFGGLPLKVDKLGIDALYSGTQKCLSCPPGLSPVTFSARAVEAIQKRKTRVPNWYLDMNMIINYWSGATRVYHHTAPINMLYGLYQALYLILDEGEENVYTRHKKTHELLVRELDLLGLKMLVDPEYRLPMLNTVVVPVGVDEARIRKELRETYRIEIGAGLGALAGKVFRIGLMGHTARKENVEKIIFALKKIL